MGTRDGKGGFKEAEQYILYPHFMHFCLHLYLISFTLLGERLLGHKIAKGEYRGEREPQRLPLPLGAED